MGALTYIATPQNNIKYYRGLYNIWWHQRYIWYTTYSEDSVAQPQDSWQDAENSIDHVEWYAEHVKRQTQRIEFVYVRHAVNDYAARLVQVVVELWRFQLVQLDQVFVVLLITWINIINYFRLWISGHEKNVSKTDNTAWSKKIF